MGALRNLRAAAIDRNEMYDNESHEHRLQIVYGSAYSYISPHLVRKILFHIWNMRVFFSVIFKNWPNKNFSNGLYKFIELVWWLGIVYITLYIRFSWNYRGFILVCCKIHFFTNFFFFLLRKVAHCKNKSQFFETRKSCNFRQRKKKRFHSCLQGRVAFIFKVCSTACTARIAF